MRRQASTNQHQYYGHDSTGTIIGESEFVALGKSDNPQSVLIFPLVI